jgi:hypothetical protein
VFGDGPLGAEAYNGYTGTGPDVSFYADITPEIKGLRDCVTVLLREVDILTTRLNQAERRYTDELKELRWRIS